MSGHNKWSKIKHRKAATDAKKSQVFGKIARLIAMESKKAGGDEHAPGLRLALERARSVNMPSENIERAIQKGISDTTSVAELVRYEAYGPGGAALVLEGITDNRNRTSAEIRHILSKHEGQLAEQGSALWAFEKSATGWKPRSALRLSEEDVARLETLIEALEAHDDIQEVFCNAS